MSIELNQKKKNKFHIRLAKNSYLLFVQTSSLQNELSCLKYRINRCSLNAFGEAQRNSLKY